MLVWNHSCKSYCSAYHEHLVKIQEEQHVSSSIHLLFFFSICCYFCLNYCFLVQCYYLITNVVIEFSLSSVSKIFSVSTLDSSWFQCSPFSIEPLVRIGKIFAPFSGVKAHEKRPHPSGWGRKQGHQFWNWIGSSVCMG